MLTKKRINVAIAHTDLKIVGNGDGYFYFVCTKTDSQIGSNADFPRLNMASLEYWVMLAEQARSSGIVDGIQPDNTEYWAARYGF